MRSMPSSVGDAVEVDVAGLRRSPCACPRCRGRPSSSRGSGGCEPGSWKAPRHKRVVSGGDHAVLQRRERHQRLDRRAGRVHAAQRAIVERHVDVGRAAPRTRRSVRPRAKPFGSKVGVLTKASTSPLRGSMATTAARWPASASSATCCRRASTARYRSLPATGSLRVRSRRADADALDAAALRVHQQLLVAGLAVQLVLVGALHAELADQRRAGVVRRRRCAPGPASLIAAT